MCIRDIEVNLFDHPGRELRERDILAGVYQNYDTGGIGESDT